MLGHKTSLNKFNRIEIISNIFFWPQQCETRNQLQEGKQEKHQYIETQQHATKNQWVSKEIKEEIRKYLKTYENENNTPKSMGRHKSSSKREVYRNIGLL